MTFIAMNRFQVKPGHEDGFERMWAERESHLASVPGFREFRLLKGPEGEGFRLYSSHVIWESRAPSRPGPNPTRSARRTRTRATAARRTR